MPPSAGGPPKGAALIAVGLLLATTLVGGCATAPFASAPRSSDPLRPLVSPTATNFTVDLSSSVSCAGLPWVVNQMANASVVFQRSTLYTINATEFCGTSAFTSFNTTGGVHELGCQPADPSCHFYAVANGTVTALYLTDPTGMYPVVVEWPGVKGPWNATVGNVSGSSSASTLFLAVSNGTYNVSVNGPGCGVCGYAHRVTVDGIGILIVVVLEGVSAPLPPPPPMAGGTDNSFTPYVPLLALFVAFALLASALCSVTLSRLRKR